MESFILWKSFWGGWFRKKVCTTRQNGAISWAVVWKILESRYGEYLKLRGSTDVYPRMEVEYGPRNTLFKPHKVVN